MKKRKLKKGVEMTLFTITYILGMFMLMIDEIELSAIPFILLALAIITINILILKKYGRGVWLENE